MKATNQGFIDLHTPEGFFVIGASFLLISVLIIIGAIYGRSVAVKDREKRRLLKEGLKKTSHHDPI